MEKREEILEVAEELFAEKGFEGTSVRELSKKAKINIAMISYYFGSKEKLFEALVEYRAGFMREKLQLLAGDEKSDPMKKMEKMIEFFVDRIFSVNRFHKILHRELLLQQRSEMHEGIADILLRNVNAMRLLINEGKQKKVFRKVDTELIVATLFGTISQATMSPQLICKIINADPKKYFIYGTKHKNRIKHYLKELIRSYLLIKK